jgi:hypothetical protein
LAVVHCTAATQMSAAAHTVQPRRRMPLAALAAGATVAAAVATGAFALTAGDAERAPAPRAAAPPAAETGSARLQTSFGAVSVDSVVRLTGSERPMGVRVRRGELPIQVAVTVTNIGERPFRVPRSMLVLEDARHGGIDPGRRTDFRVPALSAHRFILRYAVPAGVLLPDLVVRDPAGDASTRVALGRADDLSTLNVATHAFGGPAR